MKLIPQHIFRLSVTALLSMLLAVAWAGRIRTDSRPKDTATVQALSADERKRFDYFFLEAIRQQNANHLDVAFDLLRHCLDIDPQAAEVYYAQAAYYSQLKQDSLALLSLEKAAALRPDNSTYQERAAQFYIGTGQYDRAIAAYERLYSEHRDRSDVLNLLLQLYNQQKNYDKMLYTIERIEQSEGINEELALSKMSVYEMKGDKQSAYRTLKMLSDTHPNDLNYRVMLGNWLMQNNGKKKAYKIFMNVLKTEPDHAYAQSSLYDYYHEAGDELKAVQLRDKILMSKETAVQTKLTMLQQLIKDNEQQHGDSTEILQLFRRMQSVAPKEVEIAVLAAAYMSLKNLPADTVNAALQHVIDIAPDNSAARLQLLRSYLPEKDWKKIIDLCEQGTQFTPDEMAYYYYLAWAYVQQEQRPQAIDALKRGVSAINSKSEPALVSEFYGMMGDLLYQQGNESGAFAAYDSCLHWKADNISCLNNYAYYLSEKRIDLKKAEQMSYKTVKAEPANATYLDTYAWILFVQERYAEAKLYIDQALRNDTDSVQNHVIIEHAGDIYAMNGDIERALQYWNQALRLAGKTDCALLERKIKLKKYIAK